MIEESTQGGMFFDTGDNHEKKKIKIKMKRFAKKVKSDYQFQPLQNIVRPTQIEKVQTSKIWQDLNLKQVKEVF